MAATPAEQQGAVEQQVNAQGRLKPSQSDMDGYGGKEQTGWVRYTVPGGEEKHTDGWGSRQWGEEAGHVLGPARSHVATSRRTLLTEPGSLSVLSFHKHSLSASCVPGTVLGTRETARNRTGKNVWGVWGASLSQTDLAEGKMWRSCTRSLLSQEGSSHLPPMLVHGSCQCIARATGEDAHGGLHGLFPVGAF